MSERVSHTGKIVTACFFTIWCTAAFGMGLFVLQMLANTGPYGPPIFIVFIPFGMGFFGIVLCIAALRTNQSRSSSMPSFTPETITYTGDYSIKPEFSESKRSGKAIYQIPPVCPSCGASISTEEVDWVGPLQAKCCLPLY